jgi:diguanylate cyclase (GGDEF)-like protein
MSFRNRLTLFFVLIVIVPMISVAFVLFRLISDSESGKSDAAVAAKLRVASNVYLQDTARAMSLLTRLGRDPGLASALARKDAPVLRRRLKRLAPALGARRVVITRGGRVVADVGDRTATAPATRQLVDLRRRPLGELQVSVTSAASFVRAVQAQTQDPQRQDVQVVVRAGNGLLATTVPISNVASLPLVGNTSLMGRPWRLASFTASGFGGQPLRVILLSDRRSTASNVSASRELAAAILAGFFIVAFAFAVLVSRSLQGQIARFLDAARRLGTGDFSTGVPVSGRDEFAELGDEFNKMSGQLEARLDELREQRARLQQALERIGQAFASNLDRDALLELVLRTAVEGVRAAGGRATARAGSSDPLRERAKVGDLDPLREALADAEASALQTRAPAHAAASRAWALAHPLRAGDSEGEGERRAGDGRVLGVISVARADRDFSQAERELFHYLAAQAGVSLENVSLHEVVQRQAVTDELTGLYNHRRFQEALASEVERSRRFGQPVSLIMLDIDNFKQVNDDYGHQQGDLVLQEVARIVREYSREIDSPARYGGEELAVVLPQTDIEGAYQLAERVREGIEGLSLPLLEQEGVMEVTASLGVSSLRDAGASPRELVAAADAALYRAKRAGKNKTVRAQ